MRRVFRGLLLALAAAVPLRAETTETDRLVIVGKLWGEVQYFHPWLRYKPIDWDAALVRTLPRLRAAATDDEFAAAIGELLSALDDPATCVERAAQPHEAQTSKPSASPPVWYSWNGRTLLVTLSGLPAASEASGFGFAQSFVKELAKAEAVVVDARLGAADRDSVEWLLSTFEDQLAPDDVESPASRAVLLNGYPPQTGTTSGGYYQGFVLLPRRQYQPTTPSPDRRTVFIVAGDWVPQLAASLSVAGRAAIVAVGRFEPPVAKARLPLPGGWEARVRVSETVGPAPRADRELDGTEDPLPIALGLAAAPKPRKVDNGAPPTADVALPIFRPDKTYADLAYPPEEYRLLAAFRLWNVIHYFYPYLHLIDWDPVLSEFVPKLLAAADGKAYALTIAEMAAHVEDGHTFVSGHPALDELNAAATAPIAVRLIEGRPTVVELVDADAARAAGVRVGDVIVDVDGEPPERKMQRLAPYVTASTPDAKRARLAGMLLRGPEGGSLRARVRGADDQPPRLVTLVLSKKYYAARERGDTPAYRLLSPEIGYADLTRLVPSEVDAMFESFKSTHALVLDMRGYPNGTAWSIAPRINVRQAKVGALFRRPYWTGFDLVDPNFAGGASFAFEQTLPTTAGELYRGRTVMLTDERAISQSEHTGLFFEAAAGTVFIGAPTAGANGDVTSLRLPGGITMRFTGHDVRHADGRQLQRVGLQPLISVAPTLAGVRAGKDEVLDRALLYIKTGQ